MAREIRISVDDDEVFERMKRRKADLDLTWEEVLQRGLRPETPEEPRGPEDHGARDATGDADPLGEFDPFGDDPQHGRSHDRGSRSGAHRGRSPSDGGPLAHLADRLREQVQSEVRESLRDSMGAMGGDLDREMRDLQDAEDAVLSFDVLEDDARYHVPLRVRMETSRDGLDVDVVAVREGKSARGTNRFDREARRAVNEHLATGGTATLAFGTDGDRETYRVAPVCSWRRSDDGTPRVADVEIHEVVFDGE
jgi:hypothetical protein